MLIGGGICYDVRQRLAPDIHVRDVDAMQCNAKLGMHKESKRDWDGKQKWSRKADIIMI